MVACRSWQVGRAPAPPRAAAVAQWPAPVLRSAPVSPTELAIYAAEVKLIMTGLAFLAAIFFAAALLFAFFFGTVNPRLRRAVRRSKRLRDENATLHSAIRSLKSELASGSGKVAALEKMVGSFEREIQRLDGIRKRTDTSLLETKALLARLQDGKAKVDGS